MNEKILLGKKAALVIAFRDFRDEEYFIPKQILEGAGLEVKTVSTQTGLAIGSLGQKTQVDLILTDFNPVNFDAVIFVGGPGCLDNLDNENSYRVLNETVTQDKLLASICISPVILAKAGVLSGKKATVWSSALDKTSIKTLEENGAIYQDDQVVQDGKIITANGPSAAEEFGQMILETLSK